MSAETSETTGNSTVSTACHANNNSIAPRCEGGPHLADGFISQRANSAKCFHDATMMKYVWNTVGNLVTDLQISCIWSKYPIVMPLIGQYMYMFNSFLYAFMFVTNVHWLCNISLFTMCLKCLDQRKPD